MTKLLSLAAATSASRKTTASCATRFTASDYDGLSAACASDPVEWRQHSCMYLLYSALLALALLISCLWWLLQMAVRRKYRAGLSERLGFVPARLQPRSNVPCVVWIHAVSVGEVLAIAGIAEQLKQARLGLRVVVSTTTATGQKLAQQRFGAENVFFFPLDFGFCVKPYLRALQPDLVVMAETEFWPNFLRLARGSGARMAVVN